MRHGPLLSLVANAWAVYPSLRVFRFNDPVTNPLREIS
jgi:hypothetical protein